MLEIPQEQFGAALLLVFLVGFLIAWLIRSSRLSAIESILAERNEGHARKTAEFEQHLNSTQAELSERRLIEAEQAQTIGKLESQLEAQDLRNRETSRLLNSTEKRFADTFKALSADALHASQAQFVQLAKSTFQTEQKQAEGELKKREQAVAHLVQPVAESLEKMQDRIGEIEKAREGAYASIKEQVTLLSNTQAGLHKETRSLVKALRQPTGRGQWGEMQLKRVVEMAGMQEHCDFTTQTSTTTDEGKKLRPDLIVKLPGGKQIIVDSKAPMDAYLDALEAEIDSEKAFALTRHARQVATHIRQLSSKNYQAQFQPAPEFVVLFLPSESFFSAALTEDSSLLEQGIDHNIILATPTTLIALLRAVAYGWRQETLTENALKISQAGRELHGRLTSFTDHLSKVGRSLESSVKSYNSAVSSLESRVLPSARRFEDLEATSPSKKLASPKETDESPKSLRANPASDGPEQAELDQKATSAANAFRAALD